MKKNEKKTKNNLKNAENGIYLRVKTFINLQEIEDHGQSY